MATSNTPFANNASAAGNNKFAQTATVNNIPASKAAGMLKPCFKPNCALNCKHKAGTCYKVAVQQAC